MMNFQINFTKQFSAYVPSNNDLNILFLPHLVFASQRSLKHTHSEAEATLQSIACQHLPETPSTYPVTLTLSINYDKLDTLSFLLPIIPPSLPLTSPPLTLYSSLLFFFYLSPFPPCLRSPESITLHRRFLFVRGYRIILGLTRTDYG